MRTHWRFPVWVFFAFLSMTAVSYAADESYLNGLQAFQEGQFDEAANFLNQCEESSLTLDEKANLHKMLGFCSLLLNRKDSAKGHFKDALRLDPAFDPTTDPVWGLKSRDPFAAAKKEIEEEIRKKTPDEFSFTSKPDAAKVFVDERLYGKTPCTVVLTPGKTARIRIQAPGHQPVEKALTATGGRKITIFEELKPESGQIKVFSEPGGAEIYLDEKLVGQTPMIIQNLPPRRYGVRLVKKDLADHNEFIEVQSGKTANLSATLSPLYGKIQVASRPDGAEVFLDGKKVGQTPMTIPGLAPRKYQVRLMRKNYLDHQEIVEVRVDQTVSVEAVLKPLMGEISVTSAPEGADVFLDDKKVGRAPMTIPNLASQKYVVRFAKKDYRDHRETVEVRAGQTSTLNVTLKSNPAPAPAPAPAKKPEKPADDRSAWRIAGWSLVGVSAVGLTTGGIFYFRAADWADKAGEKGISGGAYDKRVKSAKTALSISQASFGIGGAAGIAGGICLWQGYRSPSARAEGPLPWVSVTFGKKSLGASVGLTW